MWATLLASAGLSAVCCARRPPVAARAEVLATSEEGYDQAPVAPGAPGDNRGGAAPDTAPDTGLAALLSRDERRAAEILVTSMCEAEAPASAWAAVYALRLGIKHDAQCAEQALASGLAADDLLLRALSWRWMAALPSAALPDFEAQSSDDPVVQVMAAMAFSRRGDLPEALRTALWIPPEDPRPPQHPTDDFQRREIALRRLAEPFDDGPLALAVAFVEARRAEAVETAPDGTARWSAERLKAALIRALDAAGEGGEPPSAPPLDAFLSRISERLDNPLISRPGDVLRAIALSGAGRLRAEGLRAIAVVAQQPVAGDFAAAAAAMAIEDDAQLRIEGARTFLLLTLRAQPSP